MNINVLEIYFKLITNYFLIGESPDQIINTLKYYKDYRSKNSPQEKEMYNRLIIPSDKEIVGLEDDINISAVRPLANVNQVLDIRVCPNVVFNVNANAVLYLKNIGQSWEKYKREDLYKFIPGINAFGVWFLPESIMKGLSEYDWSPHKQQINKWLRQREESLNKAEQAGHLVRPLKDIHN